MVTLRGGVAAAVTLRAKAVCAQASLAGRARAGAARDRRCARLRWPQAAGSCLQSLALALHLARTQEATFLPEEEQRGLAGALDAWRSAVQAGVADAALRQRVAEQQLVLAVGR